MSHTATSSEGLKQHLSNANAFVSQHLAECAQELVEFESTGILANGRVRALAELCKSFCASHDALVMAQRMVEREAIRFTAQNAKR